MVKLKHLTAIFLAVLTLFFTIAPECAAEEVSSAAEVSLSPPTLYAEAAVLMDGDTGQILYEKNMHKQMYPASITKIATCLLAMEYGKPDEIVTITDEGVFAVPRDTTHIALTGGEELTLEQLEYAMMVQSANDAANAIAIHLAGSIEQFATQMNERVQQLGAQDTHFTNANGLPDPGHYTSAHDMALITKQALTHPEFSSLAGTQSYEIPPTNKQSETRILHNNQYMFTLNDTYPGAFAGKTGWTEEAGHTLVTIAEQNGVTLICVVLHADGVIDAQYIDSTNLLDYGFQNFSRTSFPMDRVPAQEVSYTGASGDEVTVRLIVQEDLPVLLPDGMTVDQLQAEVQLPEQVNEQTVEQAKVLLRAPDSLEGQMYLTVGTFALTQQEILSTAAQSDTPTPVEENAWMTTVLAISKWLGIILAGLVILLVIVRQAIRFHYRKKKRRRQLKTSALRTERREYGRSASSQTRTPSQKNQR